MSLSEALYHIEKQSRPGMAEARLILRLKTLSPEDLKGDGSYVWDRVVFAQSRFTYLHLTKPLSSLSAYVTLSALHLLAEPRDRKWAEDNLRLSKKNQIAKKKSRRRPGAAFGCAARDR